MNLSRSHFNVEVKPTPTVVVRMAHTTVVVRVLLLTHKLISHTLCLFISSSEGK